MRATMAIKIVGLSGGWRPSHCLQRYHIIILPQAATIRLPATSVPRFFISATQRRHDEKLNYLPGNKSAIFWQPPMIE